MEKACASTDAFLEKSKSGSNSGETNALISLLVSRPFVMRLSAYSGEEWIVGDGTQKAAIID